MSAEAYKIANENYQALSSGDGDAETCRRSFYEIMLITKPEDSMIPPFLPADEQPALDPLVEIGKKVDMGASATLAPQIVGTPAAAILGEAFVAPSPLVVPTTEEVIVPAVKSNENWTNRTLREELGKHGFLADTTREAITSSDSDELVTFYVRRGYEVRLVESKSGKAPFLRNGLGQLISITQLAYRNVNMRQPTEGV